MPEEALYNLLLPAPRKGVLEGLDPAERSFSPLYAQALENLRVINGVFATRKGMALDDPDANPATTTFGATGTVTGYWTFYRANGDRYRLVIIGGVLKERLTSNNAFSNSTNGSGFSTARLANLLQLADYAYIADRANSLKRWEVTNGVTTVAQPAAPSAAPNVKPWTYATFLDWTAAVIASFTESDSGNFDIAAAGANDPEFPIGGDVVKLTADATGSKGDTITRNQTYTLASSHIAFWIEQTTRKAQIAVQLGINASDDYGYPLGPHPEKDEQYPIFIPIGDLGSISKFRFRNRKPQAVDLFISRMVLPGRLDGFYRWRYTHYDPTTGEESEPSDINSGGTPLDLSAIGVDYRPETARAFQKSAMLDVTTDAGTDAATTKLRIYRNGGVPSLTKDSRGQDVWLRVGEIYDHTTQLNGAASAADVDIDVDLAAPAAVGDWLVINKGGASQEYVKITGITTNNIQIADTPLVNAHSDNESVQIAFLDNVSNQSLAGSVNSIDAERDNPPSGIHWLARLPNGRMLAFRWSGEELGVAYSNLPTTTRPFDHEVFPDGVDPIARGHPTQGFRIRVDGDASGDEIMWGGVFNYLPTVLTRRALYQIEAYSQDQFSATSVRKVLDTVGCIAGETVKAIGGYLYWVADGPRVMRWDGRGEPQDISHLLLTNVLKNAPAAYHSQWFATVRADHNAQYYILFLTPSGATTNTLVLFYNLLGEAWEPAVYYDAGAAALPWVTAGVWDGASDARELVAVQGATGNAYQLETLLADAGVAIATRFVSQRFHFGDDLIGQVEKVYLRGASVADLASVTVLCGGSEYGNVTATYSGNDFTGSGDKECFVRVDFFNLRGRWVEITVAAVSDAGLSIREVEVLWQPVRRGRIPA